MRRPPILPFWLKVTVALLAVAVGGMILTQDGGNPFLGFGLIVVGFVHFGIALTSNAAKGGK